MRRRVLAVAATVLVVGSFLIALPASAQQFPEPSIVADAECAPDGSQQGFVISFINNAGEEISVSSATASGSLLPAEIDLTFSPVPIEVEGSATADFAVPGDAAGDLQISVTWFSESAEGTAEAGFDVTACEPTTSTTEAPTTTAPPAVAAEATATFTG
jgi:hypothetical protein